MERERKLSMTQLMALAWAGAMAPAAEVLPAAALPEGGHGAWLTGLFVLPLLLALGWLLGAAAGDGGLAQGLNRRLGPLAGGAVRILYMVWAAVLAAQRLGRCALRLSMTGSRDGSFWFFLAGLTAVSLWVARGRPAALGRMGQGLLAGLLAAAGAVLVLSLPRLRWTLLVPARGTEVLAAAKAALPAAGAMAPALYAAFLLEQTDREREGQTFLWWTVSGCLLLTAGQGIVLGCLGPVLAGRLGSPFFTLAQSVGVEGAFQRVESVIHTLWTGADLALTALLIAAAGELGGRPPRISPASARMGAAAAAAVLAPPLAAAAGARGVRLWPVTLILSALPGLLTLIFDRRRGKTPGQSTSCV